MKKSRIQNISVSHIKISPKEQKEIFAKLTRYHTKAIRQRLDKTNLSTENKLKIIYSK